jgi:hypothetical protein
MLHQQLLPGLGKVGQAGGKARIVKDPDLSLPPVHQEQEKSFPGGPRSTWSGFPRSQYS